MTAAGSDYGRAPAVLQQLGDDLDVPSGPNRPRRTIDLKTAGSVAATENGAELLTAVLAVTQKHLILVKRALCIERT